MGAFWARPQSGPESSAAMQTAGMQTAGMMNRICEGKNMVMHYSVPRLPWQGPLLAGPLLRERIFAKLGSPGVHEAASALTG